MCEHWLLLLQLYILMTWTVESIYFLNAYPICIVDGAKELHMSLQVAYFLLKSDKETLHF